MSFEVVSTVRAHVWFAAIDVRRSVCVPFQGFSSALLSISSTYYYHVSM